MSVEKLVSQTVVSMAEKKVVKRVVRWVYLTVAMLVGWSVASLAETLVVTLVGWTVVMKAAK